MESSKKKSNYLLLFYNTKAELHIPLLLSSSNASLFTQFAISYTLREKKRTKRIPITAYQSLGRMKYAGHVFFALRAPNKLWRFYACFLLFHNSLLWLLVISRIERNLCCLFIDIIEIFNPCTSFGNHNQKLFFCHFYGLILYTNSTKNTLKQRSNP